ncbi:hypothetical protein OQI_20345 [Streptomyces pharetrae CZA14]|uniref:DNA recombination protein RmuC n=1 Tax=Streptomyces pharetrae CZA14 TaxID=1144883 RepID=A0ABX3YFP7_9ACTN|nr:hypothetical protein OQI_20345 [Streptomyces pharetrae CZA14]
MNAAALTTLGTLFLGLGAVLGAAVTWLGKRSENAITGYSSLTNDLQEERDSLKSERDALKAERDALNTRLAEQAALRAADQAEIARLRALTITLGGEP